MQIHILMLKCYGKTLRVTAVEHARGRLGPQGGHRNHGTKKSQCKMATQHSTDETTVPDLQALTKGQPWDRQHSLPQAEEANESEQRHQKERKATKSKKKGSRGTQEVTGLFRLWEATPPPPSELSHGNPRLRAQHGKPGGQQTLFFS